MTDRDYYIVNHILISLNIMNTKGIVETLKLQKPAQKVGYDGLLWPWGKHQWQPLNDNSMKPFLLG